MTGLTVGDVETPQRDNSIVYTFSVGATTGIATGGQPFVAGGCVGEGDGVLAVVVAPVVVVVGGAGVGAMTTVGSIDCGGKSNTTLPRSPPATHATLCGSASTDAANNDDQPMYANNVLVKH